MFDKEKIEEQELAEAVQILTYPGGNAVRYKQIRAIFQSLYLYDARRVFEWRRATLIHKLPVPKPIGLSTYANIGISLTKAATFKSHNWVKLEALLWAIRDELRDRGLEHLIDYYKPAIKEQVVEIGDPDVSKLKDELDPIDLPPPAPAPSPIDPF